MDIKVINNTMDALMAATTEWENLSMLPKPSQQQQNRMTFLASRVKLLSNGVSERDLNRATVARLLKEVGQEYRMPRDRHASLNFEWAARLEECRANAAGTQAINYTELTAGGALVPQSISARCYETMKEYNQIFDPEFSNVIETENGANFPVPAFDDVSTSSVLVSENTNPAGGDTNAEDTSIANTGNVQMGAYTFRSGMVVLSRELETDSAFPWGELLERVFAKRHARGIGAYLITGSGSGQPTGLVTATLAKGGIAVVAAGSSANDGVGTSANSVGTQDIASLMGAVNAAYRANGVFYMSDGSMISLMKVLDKYGRPIINFVAGAPMIYGKRVAICPSFASIGSAGNNIMAFGDPDYFIQRRAVGSTEIKRYTQKYGLPEAYQVGYESWMRVDSNLLAPNSSFVPFAILQQHS
jgi:HK97 family phage major capsid protein